MSAVLRVLIIEDSEDDALLVKHELKRGGYELTCERIDTLEAMNVMLDRQDWDVIIADYSMPHFSVPAALEIVNSRSLDVPFIIVSGAIGEETAAEAMRAGAHDFVIKGNLARLVPAVERELRDARTRKERKQAQEHARALQDLRELDRLRARLLVNVSHELCTPLAAIKGFTTTLLASDVSWTKKEQQDYLRFIDKESDHLTTMVGDLVDMSRLQFGALKLERSSYQIAEILNSVSDKLKELLGQRELNLIIPEGLPVTFVDDMRIRQVLIRLMENVAGFFEENSQVTITASHADRQLVISISGKGDDTASGMLLGVFDWFYQDELSPMQRKLGAGLGLPICRGIIEAHGGRIWVSGAAGRDLIFSFSLPIVEKDGENG